MKVRWEWKWGEGYLTRTRSGERKRRGKEQTPTPTHLARSGPTLKGQEKRKTEADGHATRPAEGGRGRKRLNQPNKAKTYAYLGTRRTRPTYRWKKRTREKRSQKLNKSSLQGLSSTLDNRALFPKRDRSQVQPHEHKRLFEFQRIRCTKSSTSPETKVTTPAGKRTCLSPVMDHVDLPCKSWGCSAKMKFLIVPSGFTPAEKL